MVALAASGLSIDLPRGWDGQIRGVERASAAGADPGAAASRPAGPTPVILHAGSFPLPAERGDYGSGAVDVMTDADVLVVLFEFGPESAGTALFRRKGIPTRLTPNMFSPQALQRAIPGQAGCQLFFTEADRAFCCYTVLGRQSTAARVLPQANATLSATRISPR